MKKIIDFLLFELILRYYSSLEKKYVKKPEAKWNAEALLYMKKEMGLKISFK